MLEETPARMVAEQKLTRKRLRKKGPDGKVILPPRETAKHVMKEISLEDTAREPALTYSSIEPQNWKSCHVTFKTQLEGCKGKMRVEKPLVEHSIA